MATNQNRFTEPHLKIWDDLWGGLWRAQALAAALEFDLFTRIEAGDNTVAKLAAAWEASERGTKSLLDAMTGMGYLQKSKDQSYRLRPDARKFLVRSEPLYMGDLGQVGKLLMMAWTTLPDAVRRGGRATPERSPQEVAQFFSALVPAIFTFNFIGAKAAVSQIPSATRRQIKRILDVGAGAAPWSIPFASAIKGARVTVIDFPEVTQITRKFTERWNVADQYDYREGDYHEVDFGTEQFDAVIFGHIIHSEGADEGRKLIERAYRALRERGLLVIGEFVPNDERTGPELPLLFGLNMLINTACGDVFTMPEYHEWLRAAGFAKVSQIEIPAFSPLILASKG
jgi:ubiquinone/menaquinone biosynthesis C-methylase UbiE